MTSNLGTPVLFGPQAVLIPTGEAHSPAAWASTLRRALPDCSAVPGADTVVVRSPNRAGSVLLDAVNAALTEADPACGATDRPVVTIKVTYDGEDLSAVAALLGLSVEEVVSRHCARTYTVDFIGFAPGFPYLSGLDALLAAVPRLDTPRTRVPAGSVGVAAGRTCVYPGASPGGWHLLGRTDAVLFDAASAQHPALLTPGDRLRFTPA